MDFLRPTQPADACPPPPADAARLDEAALQALRQLDPEGRNHLLERVLRAYEGSLDRLMLQLREGRRQPDLDSIRLCAHTLKSSSSSIGASAFSALCAQVEHAARALAQAPVAAQPGGQFDEQLDRLEAEAGRVALAVQGLLHTLSPPPPSPPPRP